MQELELPFWHPCSARGFILDWDGVIADTSLDFSGIRDKYFDGKRVPLIEAMVTLSESEQIELWKDIYDLEMEGAERALPVKGAFELVQWIEERSIPWSVVSRNCRDSIVLAASKIGFSLPEITMSRDDGPVKPDPEALWLAAGRMGIPHRECVMVGDFLYDMIGARRSCMRGVLVERTGEDWNVWADVCFDTLEEMVTSLKDPTPFIPWEYHDLVAKRGKQWLQTAWARTLSFSGVDPDISAKTFYAASLGAGTLSVPSESRVTMEQWRNWPGASTEFMGLPLSRALKRYLCDHFPFVRITEDADEGYSVSETGSVLEALEEKGH